MALEIWTERFQCLRGELENTDGIVQVFFKKRIDGHNIEGLEEHTFRLSQWPALGQLLNTELVLALEKKNKSAPAADRTVPIDHNSAAYNNVDKALEKVEQGLKETNAEGLTEEDREVAKAEVSALRRMLQSLRVNAATAITLAGGVLLGLAVKFGDKLLGQLAGAAFEAVKGLLGF